MRRLIVLSALASLALAGPVLAAAKAAPAKPAAAPAAKGGVAKWNVDKAASKLGFKSSFSGTAFEGAFKTWTADIAFDPVLNTDPTVDPLPQWLADFRRAAYRRSRQGREAE